MPCMDLFEEQSAEYRESVLPKAVRKRVAVEALEASDGRDIQDSTEPSSP